MEEFSLSGNCSPPSTVVDPTLLENISNNSTSDTLKNINGSSSYDLINDQRIINIKGSDHFIVNDLETKHHSEENICFVETYTQHEECCLLTPKNELGMQKLNEYHLVVENTNNLKENNLVSSPVEERCNFSLIENYPPKERRKLENGIESETHNSGTNSEDMSTPPREIETIVYEASLPLKLKNENAVGTVRKNSIFVETTLS